MNNLANKSKKQTIFMNHCELAKFEEMLNKETTKTYSQHTKNMSNTSEVNQLSCMYKNGSSKMSYIEIPIYNKVLDFEIDTKYSSRNAFFASQSPKRTGFKTYYKKKRRILNNEAIED